MDWMYYAAAPLVVVGILGGSVLRALCRYMDSLNRKDAESLERKTGAAGRSTK